MEDTAIILWLSGIKDVTTEEGKGTTEGGQDDDWPGKGPWEGKVYVGWADLEKDDCGAKASCGLDWYILKTGRHPRIDNNLGPGKMSEGQMGKDVVGSLLMMWPGQEGLWQR